MTKRKKEKQRNTEAKNLTHKLSLKPIDSKALYIFLVQIYAFSSMLYKSSNMQLSTPNIQHLVVKDVQWKSTKDRVYLSS
jgi:hypothetical protein